MIDQIPLHFSIKYQNVCFILCEPDAPFLEQQLDCIRTQYQVEEDLIEELFGRALSNYKNKVANQTTEHGIRILTDNSKETTVDYTNDPEVLTIKIEDEDESPVKAKEFVSQIAGMTFFNFKCNLFDLQCGPKISL